MIARMNFFVRAVAVLLAMLLVLTSLGAQAQSVSQLPGAAPATPMTLPPPDDADPYDDAIFVSQSVPTSMVAGSLDNVSVTMKNSGTTTWSTASYALGSVNPAGNSNWGLNRATWSTTTQPLGQATFSFQVRAPANPGTYNFQWQMLWGTNGWFGAATPNVAVTVTAPPANDDAVVVSQSVPATMTSGQHYTVSVTLQNTGNTTWTSGAGYALGSQNPQDNVIWGTARVSPGTAVAPGLQYSFSFDVLAPAQGSYSMQWRMLQGARWFGGTSNAPVTVVAPQPPGETVTYVHTDGLGSPVARTDASGHLLSRTQYEPYGATAAGDEPTIGFTGHVNDIDTGLVYMQQRYYDPVAGRFLSVDPVTTDADTGGSFNRFAYGNNNPYKFVDPDGRNTVVAVVTGAAVIGIAAYKYMTDPQAKAVIDRAIKAWNQSDPKRNDSADTVKSDGKNGATSGNGKEAPSLPDKIVGDQSDPRAGPNSSGNKHTSGNLLPENGGKGDYKADLETLAGETRESVKGDKAPPGSQIGANGVFGRDPNSTGGKSIDIPANGTKPHETLHYD